MLLTPTDENNNFSIQAIYSKDRDRGDTLART